MAESPAKATWRGFGLGVLVSMLVLVSALGGAMADRMYAIPLLDFLVDREEMKLPLVERGVTQRVVSEESVVIEVAESASRSVVTVSVTRQRQRVSPFFTDPFGLFGPRFYQEQEPETIEQDIGTGFVVDQEQGFVVTNKHVVDNLDASYKVITKDDQEFEVERIYRDPVNDIGILKISGKVPPALDLGDSDNLKVGQFVIAIGTALGEFRHTVTTGVISGLGRGITAGSGFGGFVEQLDNVIQTDAAINPGNSGGPLLNSGGQVIGVSVAVAQSSENIGFAIPINVIKESLKNFNQTGQFDRPFLGVRYRMLPKETALMHDVPEGAIVVEVVEGTAAAEVGIGVNDIITKIDGREVKESEGGLVQIINTLRVGQRVEVEVYRDGEFRTLEVVLKTPDE